MVNEANTNVDARPLICPHCGGILKPPPCDRQSLIVRGIALTLTAQQRAVMRLIALGLTYEQAAEVLSVSRSTVHWHVTNVLNALGCDTSRQAIALLAGAGVLNVGE